MCLIVKVRAVRRQLSGTILQYGWMSSLSYVQNVSIMSFLARNFSQSAGSDLCVEDMGFMGKEPADTCIPDRIDYCTVLILHMGYALLTQVAGGLCGNSNRDDQTLRLRLSLYVITSLHLEGGELTI